MFALEQQTVATRDGLAIRRIAQVDVRPVRAIVRRMATQTEAPSFRSEQRNAQVARTKLGRDRTTLQHRRVRVAFGVEDERHAAELDFVAVVQNRFLLRKQELTCHHGRVACASKNLQTPVPA